MFEKETENAITMQDGAIAQNPRFGKQGPPTWFAPPSFDLRIVLSKTKSNVGEEVYRCRIWRDLKPLACRVTFWWTGVFPCGGERLHAKHGLFIEHAILSCEIVSACIAEQLSSRSRRSHLFPQCVHVLRSRGVPMMLFISTVLNPRTSTISWSHHAILLETMVITLLVS